MTPEIVLNMCPKDIICCNSGNGDKGDSTYTYIAFATDEHGNGMSLQAEDGTGNQKCFPIRFSDEDGNQLYTYYKGLHAEVTETGFTLKGKIPTDIVNFYNVPLLEFEVPVIKGADVTLSGEVLAKSIDDTMSTNFLFYDGGIQTPVHDSFDMAKLEDSNEFQHFDYLMNKPTQDVMTVRLVPGFQGQAEEVDITVMNLQLCVKVDDTIPETKYLGIHTTSSPAQHYRKSDYTWHKIKGEDGKSAYQSWLDQGNVGSESDFIASLKGEKGSDGKLPEVNLENVLTKFQATIDTDKIVPFDDGSGRGYLTVNTQGFGIVHLDFSAKEGSVITNDADSVVIATLPSNAPTPYELIEYQHGDGAVFWISQNDREIHGRPKSTNRYIINILGYFN